MAGYVELEIGLYRREADVYGAELRFSLPGSDAEVRLVPDGSSALRFEFEQLRQLFVDPIEYGRRLREDFFSDAKLLGAFAEARNTANHQGVPLRVRLFIGPSAPELHSLWWESLRDPQDDSPLLTSERLLFSRYLSSLDWRPVRLRPQSELRALVVIANPTDLAEYSPGGRPLAPIDVAGELQRARAGLASMPIAVLASPGSATLNNLQSYLRKGDDILYLVCHGAMIEGEPWLWLENDSGKVATVAGSEFVQRLRELQQGPRLVVLASCQSAGAGPERHSDDEGTMAALGPRLAEAGIPAVLAMQGNVGTRTIAKFMPVFFKELQRDGQIDRAMTVARGAIRDEADWWVPVLFMRLKSGRIWYAPGFAADKGLQKWPALLSNIGKKRCTPILGPGLTEPMLGSRREIARRWAETYHFPMEPHAREDLPQVAQYLAVNQQRTFPREELMKDLLAYLRKEMLEQYGSSLPDTMSAPSLPELIQAIGKQHMESDHAEPHRVLAMLRLPIYITTSVHDLLSDALTAVGAAPEVEVCRWNDRIDYASVYDREPNYRPNEKRPLVYHIFGKLDVEESLILTEDDYFDYLIGVTSNKDLIPRVVRRALTDTALLFLGFQMDEWTFRILFRSIMSREGSERQKRYAHIAAQIAPEEGRILEPNRARQYLEAYLHYQETDISIYWGSAGDFTHELFRQMGLNT